MREHYANIWPLDAVRHWHSLTAVCARCRHKEALHLPSVKAQHPEFLYLHEVEPWLVCTRCGNHEHNHVEIGRLQRNH